MLHKIVALMLATIYFAFQVELFEDEYEANHPTGDGSSEVGSHCLSWESIDKDDAAEPYVFDALIALHALFEIPSEATAPFIELVDAHPVRDKSPPQPTLQA